MEDQITVTVKDWWMITPQKLSLDEFLDRPFCLTRRFAGWRDLIKNAIITLKATGWDDEINKCDEHFGALQLFITVDHTLFDQKTLELIESIITTTKLLSSQTCIVCGAPTLHKRSHRPICEHCELIQLIRDPEFQ